jgi:hypothetical protein
VSNINQYILMVKQQLERNVALAPSAERARELERMHMQLHATTDDAPVEVYPTSAAPPPPPAALLPPPAAAACPPPPALARPRKRSRNGHGSNAGGRICSVCNQHLHGETGHKRHRGKGAHSGEWWCPRQGQSYQEWNDAWMARHQGGGEQVN